MCDLRQMQRAGRLRTVQPLEAGKDRAKRSPLEQLPQYRSLHAHTALAIGGRVNYVVVNSAALALHCCVVHFQPYVGQVYARLQSLHVFSCNSAHVCETALKSNFAAVFGLRKRTTGLKCVVQSYV